MARYIPQHLFDALVVKYLACDLANAHDEFDRLIADYRKKYPDDNYETLVADIEQAANEGRYVIRVLTDAPNSTFRSPADVLEGLMDVFGKSIALEKPIWRRMVENYFFNVQPAPIPDRVQRAREHLTAAEKVLAQRIPEPTK
jgi:hypothetical protein